MQILIADDDAVSRRLAMHALTGCGAELGVAEDGHAAWAQIQARTDSTVLILDREMPGIDGMDLCRRARLLDSAIAVKGKTSTSVNIGPENRMD